MYFTSASDINTIIRSEVFHVTEVRSSHSMNERVSQVSLLKAVEGCFQIPSGIATSRVSVSSEHEALNVQRVSRYITAIADVLSYLASISSIDIQSLRWDSRGVTQAELKNIYGYSRSMRAGRFIVHEDYRVLRCDWSDAFANLYHPKNSLETLLPIQLS